VTHLHTAVLTAAAEPTFIQIDNIRSLGVTVAGLLVILLGIIFVWRSRKKGAVSDNASGSLAATMGIFMVVAGGLLFGFADGVGTFLFGAGA